MSNALGISDACDRSVEDALVAGPSAVSTILGWFRRISLGIVRTKSVNYRSIEEVEFVETQGVTVPLSVRQLELKPEGQRAWDWKTLYALAALVLVPGDQIILNVRGKPIRYRVMGQLDWSANGGVGYEIVNDYVARPAN